MIDLKELKEKRTIIGKNIKHRNMNIDLDEIIRLQHQRSELLQETEHLRKQRNENAAMMKSKLDADRRVLLIAEGKALKEAIAVKEAALNEIEITYLSMAKSIPNYTHPEVPVGKLDADNLQIKTWGTPLHLTSFQKIMLN